MLSITVEVVKKIGQIKEKLLGCSTETDVDNVFTEFDITDFLVKTMLLRQSMQIQEVFDVPHDEALSGEDVYTEELEFFLDGKWRDLV